MPEAFSVTESAILFNGVKDIRIQEDAFRNSISTMVITQDQSKLICEYLTDVNYLFQTDRHC